MILATTQTLSSHIESSVKLQCQLTGLQHRTSQFGKPYLHLKILDSYGDTTAVVWSGNQLFNDVEKLDFKQLPTVELVGQVVQLDQYVFLKAQSVVPIFASLTGLGPTVTVPLAAQEAYEWLMSFIDRMPSESLRELLTGMLLDPQIGCRFIHSRASDENHHCYQGGLLVHCVQIAKIVEALGRELALSQSDILITQVGALLHDLGKINTVGYSNPRPMPPKLFRHEVQSLLLIAPHLNRLADVAPAEAWAITHILDRLISSKSSFDSKFIGEDLIRYADYLSAANQVGKSLKDFMAIGSFNTFHPSSFIAAPSDVTQCIYDH